HKLLSRLGTDGTTGAARDTRGRGGAITKGKESRAKVRGHVRFSAAIGGTASPLFIPAHSASLRAFTPVRSPRRRASTPFRYGLWTRVNALMLGIQSYSPPESRSPPSRGRAERNSPPPPSLPE